MTFKSIPYTPVTKRLQDMEIALVTTTGIHLSHQRPFYYDADDPDTSFRVIPGSVDVQHLNVSHFAPANEFNVRPIQMDINTVFPIERLRELAQQQLIKKVAPVHYAFMGYIYRLKKMSEALPEFLTMLNFFTPDAIVLTAGCPYSHRTAVLIQRAIESQGIPTVLITIDLIKTQNYRPPRCIYPVHLQRKTPLGAPHHVEEQTSILKSALHQLTLPQEPGQIIKIYPKQQS
ncbi:D-proline reductase (dithiol) protein PrdB [Caldalkalibacillus thermarum]|uniref:glycine/sarcosine/betaine reductase selenoprotein B family protein n=1 Tax=Caldalkalibacillus thermarum TaxID=296745 RepID=UPI0016654640|nr:glycine/sarcosine/betaine reductase selenoprotein B family protein [Caldalkalibacillus thermarum]GGK26945.1 D-proline reductase (dithiol) protein PrdB [Caldalkalibacillus thermarum]